MSAPWPRAVTTTVERFGRIDCVVAIAGINYRARIHEADLRRWGDVLSTNVVGMTTVLKHAVPHLRERTGSSIVLMGSIAAWLGSDGYSAYTASKAAVHGLAVALAQELAPRIRVCAVAPGWVETPFSVQGLTLESDPATARVEAEQAHALQRFARPSEIAETIAFLASRAVVVHDGHRGAGRRRVHGDAMSKLDSVRRHRSVTAVVPEPHHELLRRTPRTAPRHRRSRPRRRAW
jgi:NAD(P)-dependent dehydrogenase (short-subunit alcohol dehydrogenase family)